MPTFPSPPLKFRTAGFPQYGFKAGLRAAPSRAVFRLSRLPAYPLRAYGLRPSFVSSGANSRLPLCVGQVTRLDTAMRAAFAALPGGPGSSLGYSVPAHPRLSAPSAPLVGTPRFPGTAGYTRRLRCAGAPRRPASGSALSLLIPSRHVVLYDPGESVGCIVPSSFADDASLRPFCKGSALSRVATILCPGETRVAVGTGPRHQGVTQGSIRHRRGLVY